MMRSFRSLTQAIAADGLAFERRLAPAHDALIGLELHEYIGPVGLRDLLVERDAEHLHAGDAELRAYIFERLRTRRNAWRTYHFLRSERATTANLRTRGRGLQ